jgi:hypothetical protein
VVQTRFPSQDLDPSFMVLHEVARHAIHSVETIEITINTMESMRQQHLEFIQSLKPQIRKQLIPNITQTRMKNQVLQLNHLLQRSVSNRMRIQNEIALVSVPFTVEI